MTGRRADLNQTEATLARRWTKGARARFLAALRECGNVSAAARAVGLSRSGGYRLRAKDPEFAAAWDDAEQEAVDRLEQEAWRRAVEGVEEPVIGAGKLVRADDGSVVTVRKYNDRLLELLLKAHRPEKYKDRLEQQMAGKDGQALVQAMPAVHVHIGAAAEPEPAPEAGPGPADAGD